MTTTDERLEAKARREARKHGLLLRKSREPRSVDNRGEFMVIDPYTNAAIAGGKFELSAKDVVSLFWVGRNATS